MYCNAKLVDTTEKMSHQRRRSVKRLKQRWRRRDIVFYEISSKHSWAEKTADEVEFSVKSRQLNKV